MESLPGINRISDGGKQYGPRNRPSEQKMVSIHRRSGPIQIEGAFPCFLEGMTNEKLQNSILIGEPKVKTHDDVIGHYSQSGPNGSFHVLM